MGQVLQAKGSPGVGPITQRVRRGRQTLTFGGGVGCSRWRGDMLLPYSMYVRTSLAHIISFHSIYLRHLSYLASVVSFVGRPLGISSSSHKKCAFSA